MNADFYKLVRTLESLAEEKPESKKLENGKSVLKESSLKEMDKSQPSSDRGGESSGNPYAKGGKATPVKFKGAAKDAEEVLNKAIDKAYKKDVKEQQQGVAKDSLNEFAPDTGGGDGRWYTDDEIADIIGEDWFEFDLSGEAANISIRGEHAKILLVQEAQAYFDDMGYHGVKVEDVRDDEDYLSWYISGNFTRSGVAEGSLNEISPDLLSQAAAAASDKEDKLRKSRYQNHADYQLAVQKGENPDFDQAALRNNELHAERLKALDQERKFKNAADLKSGNLRNHNLTYAQQQAKQLQKGTLGRFKAGDYHKKASEIDQNSPWYNRPVWFSQNGQGVAEGSLEEVAPPGAKAERMVKHIKAGYAKDGKLTDVEKRKAYGAAWKAHNKGKVKEGEVWRPGMPPPPNPDMGSSLPPREQRRVVTPQGPDGVQQPHLPQEPKKPAQPKRSEIGSDTDVAETAKQKDKKSDRLPIYQESARYKTINKLIREEFDLKDEQDRMSIEEKDLQSSLGDELFNQLQAVQNGEAEMSESLKDALFNFYKSSGELPPEITKDEQDVNDYIMNKIQSMSSNNDDDRLPMSEDTKHKGTRYGGSAQVDDEDDEDGEAKPKAASTEKRGRGRPRKDSGDANTNAKYSGAKDLQSMIVGNVPKKSKSLEKLPTTKHKLKGEEQ